MRNDSIGLFWEDKPVIRGSGKKGPREWGPMPSIPETGWLPPADFPNLSAAKVIGLDTETFDPELNDAGPGWGRGKGHLLGVSISVEDGSHWYFPMRHETQPEMNMDPQQVLRWLSSVLDNNKPKVGANLVYDVGWLRWEGVSIQGPYYDVQYAEALLNSETPSVSLEALAQRHLGLGKESPQLYEWLNLWNGLAPTDKQRKWLYKAPVSLVGPYAEADASLPIRILEAQWPKLSERGALDLFSLECRLIPLLVDMRMAGMPVDVEAAERIYEDLGQPLEALEKSMQELTGVAVNPAAAATIKTAFTAIGLPHPVSPKTGRVSFAADILENIDNPLCDLILEHRKLTKIRGTFIKGYILDKQVGGKLYGSFHPLRGDAHGARSGRFSSSDPNLQNIPVRTAEGKLVRAAFAAPRGLHVKMDYSQIEYRMLAHHAVGAGSEELRAHFVNDPLTDYHELTIALVKKLTGVELKRRPAKTINFGLIYGMSKNKLITSLALGQSKGAELFQAYHEAAPFVRATMEAASNEVHTKGYVETVLGRRSDFDSWSRSGYHDGERSGAYPYSVAKQKWGVYNIERAFTHKALNRKLQGGAADVMKAAMVKAYEAGLFDEDACGMPRMTVHDELDFVEVDTIDTDAWRELKYVMENAVPQIKVPIIMDVGTGRNWAEAD